MPVAKEPFVVGSTGALYGYVNDRTTGTAAKLDLTGATVTVYASLNGGTEANYSATPDADQSTNKGKYTAVIPASFFTAVGQVSLRVEIVLLGLTYKSVKLFRKVMA